MAPVGQHGNVVTFHGIPNTTGLNLPPSSMFEMPKMNGGMPLMPPTGAMNSFPTFSADIPQQPAAANSIPASPFLPQNLLMSCNFSFLNPQALALYFQLQQQQAAPQPTPPTPIAPLNPFAHLMPMFAPTSLLGTSPQPMLLPNSGMNATTILAPQLPKTPQQTPPTTAFFHPTPAPVGAFNFAPALSTPKTTPTFTLVNNPPPVVQQPPSVHEPRVRRLPEHQTPFQHVTPSLPPTLEPNRPPSLRPESPTDPNLPPILEPELPCFSADFDDLSGPPDLTPSQFGFGDEPPVLELEAEIKAESSRPSSKNASPLSLVSTALTPTTSAACSSTTSPTEVAPPASLQIHPLIQFMANRRLQSPAKFAVSTPVVASMAPHTPTTPVISASTTQPPTSRGKRERSASVESNSCVMLKMPKLLPMTSDFSDISAEELSPMEAEAEEIPRDAKDEDAGPIEFEESTIAPLLFEVPVASPVERSRPPTAEATKSFEEEQKKEEETLKVGGQPPLTPVPALLIADTADSRPTECSLLSSSGVSSGNSTLLAEEAIGLTANTRTETADRLMVEAAAQSTVSRGRSVESSSRSSTPEALSPVHNSKLRPRASRPPTKKPKKSTPKRAPRGRGGRRKWARVRSVSIKSNWRPVDEGTIQEIRCAHETQYQRRRCYEAIRHQREYDEVIRARDCVRVRSSEGLENVGKIVRLFLDDTSGSICAEVLWYYAPDQVSQDVGKWMHEKELLASKHCDIINVDAIEEHAFVLSFSEYCRFVAETRLDEMPPERRPFESTEIWPRGEENYTRRPRLPHEDTPIDLVYFCRNVYSLRTRKLIVSASSRRGSKSSTGGRRHFRSHHR